MSVTAISWSEGEAASRDFEGVAELTIEPGTNGCLVLLVEGKPFEGVKYLDEAIERPRFLFDSIEQCLGLMHFGNVDVIHALEFLHSERLRHGFLHWLVDEELTAPLSETIDGLSNPK